MYVCIYTYEYDHYWPIEAPFSPDGIAKEILISTCGNSIDLIVRTHDTGHLPFLYARSKGHIVCILQILFAHLPTCAELLAFSQDNAPQIIKGKW